LFSVISPHNTFDPAHFCIASEAVILRSVPPPPTGLLMGSFGWASSTFSHACQVFFFIDSSFLLFPPGLGRWQHHQTTKVRPHFLLFFPTVCDFFSFLCPPYPPPPSFWFFLLPSKGFFVFFFGLAQPYVSLPLEKLFPFVYSPRSFSFFLAFTCVLFYLRAIATSFHFHSFFIDCCSFPLNSNPQ